MIEDLKSYREYKESGLPWVPLVPAHWSLIPNRAVLRKRKVLVGGNHKKFQLLSLTKGGVIVRDISSGKGKFSSDMGTSQEVRKGDFVFCLFDVPETPRTVGLSTYDGMITSAYTVFESRNLPPAGLRYLERFYIAMDDRKLLRPLYSGLRNTIPPQRFLGIKTPQPPPEEQTAIVRFLEQANSKIDGFIRAKRKLIALLNEQKKTIVHCAVTRGLNPDVPLKPSGIPWLGDIPRHWDLLPNRALLRLRKELVGDRSEEYTLLSLTLRGVIARDMENPTGKFPAEFNTYQKVGPGDLIFCLFDIDETPRAVGLSRLAGMITGAYTVFESLSPELAEYLFLFYLAMDEEKALKPLYTGLRKTIPKARFLGTKTPIPLEAERAAIIAHVGERTAHLSTAIARTQREIALMNEYRARLTADIVTGKLDVREAVAKLPDLPVNGTSESISDETLDEIETEESQ
jgi:type I restriction enzyme, S subunit